LEQTMRDISTFENTINIVVTALGSMFFAYWMWYGFNYPDELMSDLEGDIDFASSTQIDLFLWSFILLPVCLFGLFASVLQILP